MSYDQTIEYIKNSNFNNKKNNVDKNYKPA